MKKRTLDMTGERHGKMLVIGMVDRQRQRLTLCRCECGAEKVVYPRDLRIGSVKSCGSGKCRTHAYYPRKNPPSLRDRFYSHTQPEPNTGCLLWTGCYSNMGYGKFSAKTSRPKPAHRTAWEIEKGPIPAGMCVLHRCDTPACVNVDHLFVGTQVDNIRDMVAKGRHVSNSRLSGSDIDAMVAMRARGESQSAIAAAFGVSQACVSDWMIRRGLRSRCARGATP